MALSSGSVIHYTRNKASLLGIIQQGFAVKYCKEKFKFFLDDDKIGHFAHAFPMVSFCDIPFSQASKHIEDYGHFAIGLDKGWAKQYSLTPVLYVDEDSALGSTISALANFVQCGSNTSPLITHAYFHYLSYTKNAIGTNHHTGNSSYSFYDEREWRYVPKFEHLQGAEFRLKCDDYDADKTKYNNTLSHLKLDFGLDDISYIIVGNDGDIDDVVALFRTKYGRTQPRFESQLARITITTIARLKTDF